MKKWIVFWLLFPLCVSSYSQNLDLLVTATGDSIKRGTSIISSEENNSIKYLKKKYSIKDYEYSKSDTYKPDIAFLLSLIPLTGHFYVDEHLRGLLFLGGAGVSWFSLGYGLSLPFLDEPFGAYLIAIGAVGIPLFFFWRIFNVAKIAKVKNLAFRDKTISLNLIPYLELKNHFTRSNSFGATIALKF